MMDLKSETSETPGLQALHFNQKDDLKGRFLPVCIEEVHSKFIIIGDPLGATQCLQSLGNILQMQSQYEEARLNLEVCSEFTC